MAEINMQVSVKDIPLMHQVVELLGESVGVLADAKLKLSNTLRADDPLLTRIEALLDRAHDLEASL